MLTLFLVIFLCLICLQLVFLSAINFGFLKYKQIRNTDTEPVSVIIAGHNEEENLKKLLPALSNQSYEAFEIIIVNDRSTDDTYDYLKQAATDYPNLKVVTVEHTPEQMNAKKYALTLGIKAASHDLLLFTDADCVPTTQDWVKTMTAAVGDKQFVLGFSDYEKSKGLLNYFIRFETIITAIQYISFALLGRPYMGVGRNLAYRKQLFLENKGFKGYMNITGGDDDLFVNKHADDDNTVIAIGKDSNTISQPKETWKAFFYQKLRHLSVGKYYKTFDKIILGLFSLSYLGSWLLLLILLIFQYELYVVIGSFLIKTLLFHLTFILSTKKLNVTFNVWGLIILEIIYVIYYSCVGVVALFTKRVRWS